MGSNPQSCFILFHFPPFVSDTQGLSLSNPKLPYICCKLALFSPLVCLLEAKMNLTWVEMESRYSALIAKSFLFLVAK